MVTKPLQAESPADTEVGDDTVDSGIKELCVRLPAILKRNSIKRVSQGRYRINGREVLVQISAPEGEEENQEEARGGEGEEGGAREAVLVVRDGPLSQPFVEYIFNTGRGERYDMQPAEGELQGRAAQQAPDRFGFENHNGMLYDPGDRIAAMQVAWFESQMHHQITKLQPASSGKLSGGKLDPDVLALCDLPMMPPPLAPPWQPGPAYGSQGGGPDTPPAGPNPQLLQRRRQLEPVDLLKLAGALAPPEARWKSAAPAAAPDHAPPLPTVPPEPVEPAVLPCPLAPQQAAAAGAFAADYCLDWGESPEVPRACACEKVAPKCSVSSGPVHQWHSDSRCYSGDDVCSTISKRRPCNEDLLAPCRSWFTMPCPCCADTMPCEEVFLPDELEHARMQSAEEESDRPWWPPMERGAPLPLPFATYQPL
mmetsp:Transcript_104673/g.296213  ORF Transcript_104673/g.296213 Transcript_104673/m.296213 type:complete len:425 (+) Transcript_104673:221-1495(+)